MTDTTPEDRERGVTDADTEAGRGEGLEAFEVELRDLAERMLDRGKENEGNAVMVMADKLERLRESDPGGEPVDLPPDSITRYVVEPCLPDLDCGWGAWEYENPLNGATCELWEAMAERDPAAPTDEAPEGEDDPVCWCGHRKSLHYGSRMQFCGWGDSPFHSCACGGYRGPDAPPPVEEGERGEAEKKLAVILDKIGLDPTIDTPEDLPMEVVEGDVPADLASDLLDLWGALRAPEARGRQ